MEVEKTSKVIVKLVENRIADVSWISSCIKRMDRSRGRNNNNIAVAILYSSSRKLHNLSLALASPTLWSISTAVY